MASMNMEEQLDEQPPAKKPRIDNPEKQGVIANSNEAGVPKSAEMMGHKEMETAATKNLPISRPLPLELNCEIFKCLKMPVQRKFIWGLGKDIYGMFGQKLLKKTKRVRNPHANRLNANNTGATITADGMNARSQVGFPNVFAEQPFPISGPHCRVDGFPGIILYYYEVKGNKWCYVGLSDGVVPDGAGAWIGEYPNSYAIPTGPFFLEFEECWLDGERHHLELPEGVIQPRWKSNGSNVSGCGIVLDPEDNLSIFFTLNGKLKGRKIRISPTVDRLFPAVTWMWEVHFEANFGDDRAKPFEYDLKNCPGLELACI